MAHRLIARRDGPTVTCSRKFARDGETEGTRAQKVGRSDCRCSGIDVSR